jgi:phosphoglycolate phosphatase
VGHLHRLIVFDLDGTLIDSRQDLTDSANALIRERGGLPLPPEEVASMIGEGAAVLVRRALGAAGLEVDAASLSRFLELYDERLLLTTRAYSGMESVLDTLARRAALAVLTNKPIKPTHTLLGALGLARFFAAVIGGDGPFPRKPDPTSLRHLMQLHGVTGSDTVLVGDSRIDLETARAAGTGICLVRFGFGYQTLLGERLREGELTAEQPREIPGIVERLLAGSAAHGNPGRVGRFVKDE